MARRERFTFVSAAYAVACAVACVVTGVAGCSGGTTAGGGSGGGEPVIVVAGGDRVRGKTAIRDLGCGACHLIPGVRDATGMVGPPLMYFGRRAIIAGQLPNNSDNLMRWIREPQSVVPGTAMPDLGVTTQQARDIAAYLAALR